jgi:hypothetical protein
MCRELGANGEDLLKRAGVGLKTFDGILVSTWRNESTEDRGVDGH